MTTSDPASATPPELPTPAQGKRRRDTQRHSAPSISSAPETIRFCEAHLAAMTDLDQEWHDWGQ